MATSEWERGDAGEQGGLGGDVAPGAGTDEEAGEAREAEMGRVDLGETEAGEPAEGASDG